MPQPGRTLPKRLTTPRGGARRGRMNCSAHLAKDQREDFAKVMGWPSAGELNTFLSEGVKEGGEN